MTTLLDTLGDGRRTGYMENPTVNVVSYWTGYGDLVIWRSYRMGYGDDSLHPQIGRGIGMTRYTGRGIEV